MATMRVTYYALKRLQVGSQFRDPGDLVPEVADWPYLTHYIQEGKVAAVLVVTLPAEAQEMLSAWEKQQQGGDEPVSEQDDQEAGASGDEDVTDEEASPVVVDESEADDGLVATGPKSQKGKR